MGARVCRALRALTLLTFLCGIGGELLRRVSSIAAEKWLAVACVWSGPSDTKCSSRVSVLVERRRGPSRGRVASPGVWGLEGRGLEGGWHRLEGRWNAVGRRLEGPISGLEGSWKHHGALSGITRTSRRRCFDGGPTTSTWIVPAWSSLFIAAANPALVQPLARASLANTAGE
jgi:hypothetical protein